MNIFQRWFQYKYHWCFWVLPLMLVLGFPGTSFAHTHSPYDDSGSIACSAPVAQSLTDGSILGSSCFGNPSFALPFSNEKAATVIVSFFSQNPQNWQQCVVSMQVEELNTQYILPYTVQSYNCLQDASNSRQNVSYGDTCSLDTWYNVCNALFTMHPGYTYQVNAFVTYQYNSFASFQLPIQSNAYLSQ